MTDEYDVYIYGVSDALSVVNLIQFATWTTTNVMDNILNVPFFFDGLTVIDLTSTFGVGNEPDKAKRWLFSFI